MKFLSFASPINISYMWNMGSMLSLIMINQIITGLLTSMHFVNSTNYAFFSYMMLSRNIKMGFFVKFFHANGASLMFFLVYLHIYRSFLNKSTKNFFMLLSGLIIILLMMMIAFIGYVLPWGQMSFWAATVITNLISSIPYLGNFITKWLWGSFSVSMPTLNRFFSFHFFFPFILMFLIFIHILILHKKGSNNPMGMNSNIEKVPFKEYFLSKDILTIILLIWLILIISLIKPYMFLDPENFIPANPMITPNHIKPEWYFLFAYAILRSVPNKLGGVISLIMSIIILIMKLNSKSSKFNLIYLVKNKIIFLSFMILSFLGSKPIEMPYLKLSKMFSVIYFLSFI